MANEEMRVRFDYLTNSGPKNIQDHLKASDLKAIPKQSHILNSITSFCKTFILKSVFDIAMTFIYY